MTIYFMKFDYLVKIEYFYINTLTSNILLNNQNSWNILEILNKTCFLLFSLRNSRSK